MRNHAVIYSPLQTSSEAYRLTTAHVCMTQLRSHTQQSTTCCINRVAKSCVAHYKKSVRSTWKCKPTPATQSYNEAEDCSLAYNSISSPSSSFLQQRSTCSRLITPTVHHDRPFGISCRQQTQLGTWPVRRLTASGDYIYSALW